MEPEEFEAETIRRARDGDAEAGREAIQSCVAGLYAGRISEPLRFYLAGCLNDFLNGMPIGRAMCVEVERARGRPSDPLPEWEVSLAALAALLFQRHYPAEAINEAMSKARSAEYIAKHGESAKQQEYKDLERSQAARIRKTYEPMQSMSERDLIALCSPVVRDLLRDIPRRPNG